jgi:hypothetical protein
VPPSTTSRRPSRLLPTLGAVTLPALVASALLVAHAAAIGLSSKKLAAFTVTGGPTVPTVYAATDFTGTSGPSITTVPLPTGQTWTINAGTWTISNNEAAVSNTALANAWVSAGTNSAAVQVNLIFTQTSRRSGVTLLDNGTNRLYAVVSQQTGGRVQLYKQVGGTTTLLAAANGLGTPASAILRVEAFSSTINVYFAGALVITYVLNPTEVGQFEGPTNVRYGLMADGDSNTLFDDFLVTGP